jgi:peroxiredoxin
LVGLRDLTHAFRDVTFLAISPDLPAQSATLDREVALDGRGGLGIALLSDRHAAVIDRYGLRDPEYARQKIDGVPHPAVFVLDQRGRVRWSKIETDYRERPSNEEVSAALDAFE